MLSSDDTREALLLDSREIFFALLIRVREWKRIATTVVISSVTPRRVFSPRLYRFSHVTTNFTIFCYFISSLVMIFSEEIKLRLWRDNGFEAISSTSSTPREPLMDFEDKYLRLMTYRFNYLPAMNRNDVNLYQISCDVKTTKI